MTRGVMLGYDFQWFSMQGEKLPLYAPVDMHLIVVGGSGSGKCKRQVLSSKKWQLISSIFWQLSTSILYTPTDCSVGIFLLKRKFHFFHSL